MWKLTWSGITILLGLGYCDVAVQHSIGIPSAYFCENIHTNQIIRWDGRDKRTKLWLLNSKEVWDIDNKQLILLDKKQWKCIIDKQRSLELYKQ